MIFTIENAQIMISTKCWVCVCVPVVVVVGFFSCAAQNANTFIRMVTLKPQKRISQTASSDSLLFFLFHNCVKRCVVPWIIFHFRCVTSEEFQAFSFSMSHLGIHSLFALKSIQDLITFLYVRGFGHEYTQFVQWIQYHSETKKIINC